MTQTIYAVEVDDVVEKTVYSTFEKARARVLEYIANSKLQGVWRYDNSQQNYMTEHVWVLDSEWFAAAKAKFATSPVSPLQDHVCVLEYSLV
jgi:hypothetical protein